MTILYTDRSRIETGEHCARKLFWQYHYLGKGLEKDNDLKLDARIGTWTHWGIEYGIEIETKDIPGPSFADAAIDAGNEFVADCKGILGTSLMDQPSQLQHDIIEGGQIVTALVYAWLRVKAPRLLQDGEVLAIEKELAVDFEVPVLVMPVPTVTVRLMARPDVIWRRRQDGTIFIRNLKTVRKADDRWREKWALDMQTLSEPLAVDEFIRTSHENWLYPCGGVIIDGLVTGEVLFDKYRQVFYHNNPLVYAWLLGGAELATGTNLPTQYYARYEYTCTAPHKLGNGHNCEGGKSHRLAKGVRKVAVADHYPGGIISWIDYLIANDPALIDEMLIELPPIIRSDYQIERWKRQVLAREVRINRDAARVNAALPDIRAEHILDATFPMSTAGGNCLYPGKCMAYDLCHGSAAVDPLNSGFRFRVANHPQEGEQK